MLIKVADLKRIRRGEITLAFRRWRRPTVKTGGTLKTAIGILSIEEVMKTRERDLSDADARRAGFADKKALLDALGSRPGDLYRVRLSYAGADPRVQLRNDACLTDDEFTDLCVRLDRLDASSRAGPWTREVLTAINGHPRLSAAELASQLGRDKDWLKGNVRKLKNLGLTVSERVGYTLSPRGLEILGRLEDGDAR